MQQIFEIKKNYAIAQDVFKLELAGDTSDIVRPGQFVNISLGDFSCAGRSRYATGKTVG